MVNDSAERVYAAESGFITADELFKTQGIEKRIERLFDAIFFHKWVILPTRLE
tara:strand:- start:1931 stop:2089 length:159 start_codon:yes stop_codon:yes gene_type:complete